MAVTLNASTSSGFIATSDTSGVLELQNNGTTRMTVNSSGVSFAAQPLIGGVTPPAFSAYVLNGNANYSLPSNTYTKVRYDTEFFDIGSCFDTTNYRFTPNVAGYYFVTAKVFISYASSATARLRVALYKNGSMERYHSITGNLLYENVAVSSLIYMNGTTDYLEVFCLQTSSTDAVVVRGSQENEFAAYLARGA